jgi:hypothetical protein
MNSFAELKNLWERNNKKVLEDGKHSREALWSRQPAYQVVLPNDSIGPNIPHINIPDDSNDIRLVSTSSANNNHLPSSSSSSSNNLVGDNFPYDYVNDWNNDYGNDSGDWDQRNSASHDLPMSSNWRHIPPTYSIHNKDGRIVGNVTDIFSENPIYNNFSTSSSSSNVIDTRTPANINNNFSTSSSSLNVIDTRTPASIRNANFLATTSAVNGTTPITPRTPVLNRQSVTGSKRKKRMDPEEVHARAVKAITEYDKTNSVNKKQEENKSNPELD